ncbi:MAG: glycoside hydrolase family 3 C-terminal domain-containing protein, partial [Sedimentisphaerales bacterium]|nr:glycoside hydrolase family 3 C-terminal domain-containing protein [Sedimentisphaerales bacterium]
ELVDGFNGGIAFEVIDSEYLHTIDESGRKVNGLTGQYFNGTDLKGKPVFSRIDKLIDFSWQTNSPTSAPGADTGKVNNDNFSARWTGQLTPAVSGEYLLGINSDDGCRLYVNGEKIAEDWTGHAMKKTFAKINLEAGKSYDIKIEYYEGIMEAGVEFIWAMQDSVSKMFDKAVEYTRQADVAIFVGGLNPEIEGEEMGVQLDGFRGGDRTKIELPESQQKLLKAIYETGTPVVFVITGGGGIAVNWADENLPAILMAWYPGQRGGNAVADVLFGDYNPAGRLPVTFYKSTEELGDFRDYNMSAGKGKTYRYYKGEPLYPFGHGLSYSKFEYSDIKLSRKKIEADGSLTVSCKVKNTCSYDGEEVVQLYLRDVESSLPMPVKQLRGFERVELKKGQTKEVTFNLNAAEDMRYYDAKLRKYDVEPGEYEIQIGASSSDIRLKDIVEISGKTAG